MANVHPVNKIVYIIIAFFLGGLGIQEFYAGHTGLGILCLLFCYFRLNSFLLRDLFCYSFLGSFRLFYFISENITAKRHHHGQCYRYTYCFCTLTSFHI